VENFPVLNLDRHKTSDVSTSAPQFFDVLTVSVGHTVIKGACSSCAMCNVVITVTPPLAALNVSLMSNVDAGVAHEIAVILLIKLFSIGATIYPRSINRNIPLTVILMEFYHVY